MKKITYAKQKTCHHRLPKCCGGADTSENTSLVPRNKHEAYHLLFDHGGDVRRIAQILNEVWIDPKYQLVVVENVKVNPNQLSMFDG